MVNIKREFRKAVTGYSFIGLALIGVIVFRLVPMLQSLYYSFTQYDILTPPKWIGFTNYIKILFEDDLFRKSLGITAYYVGFSIPVRLVLALMLAMLLNQKIRGIGIFRTIFYLPTVTAMVAIAILWSWAFEPTFGIVNHLLKFIGIKGPAWLGDPNWALPAIAIVACWQVGAQMVIFLAGLQSISSQMYEAAEIDGAGSIAKFFHITIPLLSPVIFFNMVIGIIQSFQVFGKVYVMTGGGPVKATYVYVLYLYTKAFTHLEMGYGSALAWILFIIILFFTLIQFRLSKWVYYEGGQRS